MSRCLALSVELTANFLDNNLLRNIFRTKVAEVKRDKKKLHNGEFQDVFFLIRYSYDEAKCDEMK